MWNTNLQNLSLTTYNAPNVQLPKKLTKLFLDMYEFQARPWEEIVDTLRVLHLGPRLTFESQAVLDNVLHSATKLKVSCFSCIYFFYSISIVDLKLDTQCHFSKIL